MRSQLCASAILVGLALSPSSAATAAERCVVPPSELFGVRDASGKCVGVRREIAARILSLERSECAPPRRDGMTMFGRCLPDDPRQAEEEAAILAQRALADADEVLKDEMAQIRAQLDRQLADLSAKIEELRGRLRDQRPDWDD